MKSVLSGGTGIVSQSYVSRPAGSERCVPFVRSLSAIWFARNCDAVLTAPATKTSFVVTRKSRYTTSSSSAELPATTGRVPISIAVRPESASARRFRTANGFVALAKVMVSPCEKSALR
jgi:hypothetical protein